jgi:hypothetical protein
MVSRFISFPDDRLHQIHAGRTNGVSTPVTAATHEEQHRWWRGGLKHGRYVAHDEKKHTPLCDLFVTMLNTVGLETESFGQSRGSLTW